MPIWKLFHVDTEVLFLIFLANIREISANLVTWTFANFENLQELINIENKVHLKKIMKIEFKPLALIFWILFTDAKSSF